MPTYEPPSFSKVFGGATTHVPHVYLDIEVSLSVDVLDLVDPWVWFSVFEDGRGVVGQFKGHGWQVKLDNVGNTSKSRCYYNNYHVLTCVHHTFAQQATEYTKNCRKKNTRNDNRL